MSKHLYVYNQFSEAIFILATSEGDARQRLLKVFRGPLYSVEVEHLPEKLREDFLWVCNAATKYSEEYDGQLIELARKEKLDSKYREKYPWHYPDKLEATFQRIRRSTAAAIARKIYNIYDSLNSTYRDS